MDASQVVLFDFDGVLVRGDTFYLFMRDRYARAWWRRLAAVLVLPWLVLQWPFSRRRALRTLVHVGLWGLDEQGYREAAGRFGASLARRPGQFCRDGLRQLRRHLADGHRVLVVTGCEAHLTRTVLEELGLGGIPVVASSLRPGWLGMRTGRHNVGREKVRSLTELAVSGCAVAYSDSSMDIPMLKLAEGPVLVNASPSTCKRVERALGKSVDRVEWY
ncbi:HAD family hydrolase [Dyella sp. A6]|uniref:HAD family hydrolase n=1 Tax=Dyella aluminiiresistens TaxID=3069105 RepID=UPI002E78A9B7|nr:HAD family hydrolase [Dyella sp. A6]